MNAEQTLALAVIQSPKYCRQSWQVAKVVILANTHLKRPNCRWLATQARTGENAKRIFSGFEFQRQTWSKAFAAWFYKQPRLTLADARAAAVALLERKATT